MNERVFLRVMAGGLLDRGSLPLRDRELVIDRTRFHAIAFATNALRLPLEPFAARFPRRA